MSNISFYDAIISPKSELVNTFSKKIRKFFRKSEIFAENLFTKREKYVIIIP